jgi:hypothetical protein
MKPTNSPVLSSPRKMNQEPESSTKSATIRIRM